MVSWFRSLSYSSDHHYEGANDNGKIDDGVTVIFHLKITCFFSINHACVPACHSETLSNTWNAMHQKYCFSVGLCYSVQLSVRMLACVGMLDFVSKYKDVQF